MPNRLKIFGTIDAWPNRQIQGQYISVYGDGMGLKRSWGGKVRNLAVRVAIGMNEDGFRLI